MFLCDFAKSSHERALYVRPDDSKKFVSVTISLGERCVKDGIGMVRLTSEFTGLRSFSRRSGGINGSVSLAPHFSKPRIPRLNSYRRMSAPFNVMAFPAFLVVISGSSSNDDAPDVDVLVRVHFEMTVRP